MTTPLWRERASIPVRALKGVVIAAIIAVMVYPFVYVVLASFGTNNSFKRFGLVPSEFSFEAYGSILSGGVVTRALFVSIGITLVGTALSVFLTATLAYGLSRTREVPGTRAVLYLVLVTMFFAAGIIPTYLLVKGLGLIDSYWSLILPSLVSAFNMVVMRNFFMRLPKELLDAARIDGAGEWQTFLRIVLPLSKAVIAVIALFYAVAYWNSFFNAILYLNDATKWPIQLVLNQYVLQGASLSQIQNPEAPQPPAEAVQMAVVVLSTLPIVIVYPFLQRYFSKGVLTGAVKG
ncbi:carbohydrate ABC transporter permease [Fodinicola acaciae]|uniref:carbohydrate ABC transporter permease n=1 Tax=Fodinicola acaciae TaxID=2681555 RepID=UPI0013D13205|nr:carbohydrate ABC transporter permease [Fodinicola acaciae]